VISRNDDDHGIVKDQRTRREVDVFSVRQDDVILDMDVTVFVSDCWGDFVDLLTSLRATVDLYVVFQFSLLDTEN